MNPTKLILGVLTPLIAAGSAWLVAAAAKYGLHLDPSGVNALAVTGATAGTAAMVKLIHDVEHKPHVAAVIGDAEKVVGAVEAADPSAKQTLEDAVAEVQRAAEAKFAELEAKIPQPPVAPAPPVAPVEPAPVAPVAPPVAPPPAV